MTQWKILTTSVTKSSVPKIKIKIHLFRSIHFYPRHIQFLHPRVKLFIKYFNLFSITWFLISSLFCPSYSGFLLWKLSSSDSFSYLTALSRLHTLRKESCLEVCKHTREDFHSSITSFCLFACLFSSTLAIFTVHLILYKLY